MSFLDFLTIIKFVNKKIYLKGIFLLLICVSVPAQNNENASEFILERINEHLLTSNYNDAIVLFDTIPAPERNSSYIRLIEASILISAGRNVEARRIIETINRAEPQNTDALFILSTIEGIEGRARQQQQALERILNIDPGNTQAIISLGNLHLSNRNVRQAASNFHQIIRQDPENLDALLGLGRTFRMNREFEQAELYLNRAVELHPEAADARVERARFNRGRGFLIMALDDLNDAIKLDPYDYWISTDRGILLVEMNRRGQALEEFNRAIGINPDIFLAYAYSAPLKDEFGDHDGAMRDYAALARLRPDYHYSLEGLGLHHMRREEWENARDVFMEAYGQAPNEHHYALLAAIAWMRMGDITAPRTFLFQTQAKVTRDTLEWHMFRLFHDLANRNFASETDLLHRLEREQDEITRARMTFFMGKYYDVRGNISMANRQYLRVLDLNQMAIPEWRLNDWILTNRNIKPF